MPIYTPKLRLVKQQPDENPDTWGTTLNQGLVDAIEQAVAGMSSVVVASGVTVALTSELGAPDEARSMALYFTGVLGAAGAPNDALVVLPAVQKMYVVINATTTSGADLYMQTVGNPVQKIKVVGPGRRALYYTDGTNITLIASGDYDTTAANAATLNGVAANLYARRDTINAFTAGQATTPVLIDQPAGGNVTIDFTLSNMFRLVIGANATLVHGSGALDGQTFVIRVRKTVANITLSFGPTWFYMGQGTPGSQSAAVNGRDFITGYFDGADGIFYYDIRRGSA